MATSRVLIRGLHRGYEYVVGHSGIQFRVGYVRIPTGHPWFGEWYDDIDADVHGGLTYVDDHCPLRFNGEKPPGSGEWWIGFDCGHGGDARDSALPYDRYDGYDNDRKINAWDYLRTKMDGPGPFDEDYEVMGRRVNIIRDTAYVEEQCKSLIDQAVEAESCLNAPEPKK